MSVLFGSTDMRPLLCWGVDACVRVAIARDQVFQERSKVLCRFPITYRPPAITSFCYRSIPFEPIPGRLPQHLAHAIILLLMETSSAALLTLTFVDITEPGLTTAACQSKPALVVSMRIRNTGESLSRPFPRLQRVRHCRGTASPTHFQCRPAKCPPFPSRPTSTLPPLLPAATCISHSPTCRCCPPSHLHRHRGTSVITSAPLFASSLPITAFTVLQRGLPAAALSTNGRTQAQSSRRRAARSSTNSRATSQSLRPSNGKCLAAKRKSGIFPPPVSSSAAATRPTFPSSSHAPSPPSQPAS